MASLLHALGLCPPRHGSDFANTEWLIEKGQFLVDPKKTFLTPLLYSIPALLRIPVLDFVAVVQHVFGVLLVVTGLLALLWFSSWRLWIVPLPAPWRVLLPAYSL